MNTSIHPAAQRPEELKRECRITRTRRSGPGGQHRNKVETAIVITHLPTGISAEANERRSQAENLDEALFRLRINLAVDVRMKSHGKAAPSSLWKSRCPAGKIGVNPRHTDFPAILAEALDALAAVQGDLSQAATNLETTASQLVRLISRSPRALELVNRERQARGQYRLRPK